VDASTVEKSALTAWSVQNWTLHARAGDRPARGDRGDGSLRRSNQSDYLLTGLVTCSRCGKRYIGAAARAKSGRYRYYVCFSRQRYGRRHCDGDNLPADQLEQLILAQLDHVLHDTPLLEQAIGEAHAELDADRPRRERLCDQLAAETKRIDSALGRYFDAFEAGTLSADACKHRVDDLAGRRSALEQQRAELDAEIAETPAPPTADELAALAAEAATIIRNANPRHTKTLLQALIDRIDVHSRTNIQPVFYVPAVRPPDGSVPPARIELAHAV
jgi:site-specific DNA recombinase